MPMRAARPTRATSAWDNYTIQPITVACFEAERSLRFPMPYGPFAGMLTWVFIAKELRPWGRTAHHFGEPSPVP
jgi:hypothetical protein